MDFLAFGTILGDDELADYFMFHKVRYLLENTNHSVTEWLFTVHNEPNQLEFLELSLHEVFNETYSDQIRLILENLETDAYNEKDIIYQLEKFI